MALRTMKNMKEIDQATATNPQSNGGLLSLDHGDDNEDVGEGGDPSGGDSDGVSPFQSSPLQPLFSCLCTPFLSLCSDPTSMQERVWGDVCDRWSSMVLVIGQ